MKKINAIAWLITMMMTLVASTAFAAIATSAYVGIPITEVQSDWYMKQARKYQREAEYYTKQVANYDKDAD